MTASVSRCSVVPFDAVALENADMWAGGWEELFPDDAPGSFGGRALPDHGEWWTLKWDVTLKELSLGFDDATLQLSYRIQNLEANAFHFPFKQHLPIQLASGTLMPGPGRFARPHVRSKSGAAVDLSKVRGADDPAHIASIRLEFNHGDLPYLWLLLTYVGWRDCHTAVANLAPLYLLPLPH